MPPVQTTMNTVTRKQTETNPTTMPKQSRRVPSVGFTKQQAPTDTPMNVAHFTKHKITEQHIVHGRE